MYKNIEFIDSIQKETITKEQICNDLNKCCHID